MSEDPKSANRPGWPRENRVCLAPDCPHEVWVQNLSISPREKTYLGDAVYAKIEEGRGVWLTTEDGFRATNKIFLEPEVLMGLLRYLGVRFVP